MTGNILRWGTMAAALMLAVSSPARAGDALIEGAKQCTQYFPIKERQYGIPVHLLAAISSIETGRYHKGLGMALPWPWTINVEGKGYFFNSKAEAIAETARHIRMGKRSIDVGCMQVNLKYHPDAFANLNDAFDPEKNVDYAARFLKNNYADLGNSWVKAAAAYHSRTPAYGNPYLKRVATAWQKIVTKVQQAQSRSGGAPVQVASANQDYRVVNPAGQDAAQAAAAFSQVADQAAPAAPAKPMNRIESVRKVKVISVSADNAAKRANVMVVSTPTSAASYTPVANSPQANPVKVAQETPAARTITPRRVVVEGNDGMRRQPTFVFAN